MNYLINDCFLRHISNTTIRWLWLYVHTNFNKKLYIRLIFRNIWINQTAFLWFSRHPYLSLGVDFTLSIKLLISYLFSIKCSVSVRLYGKQKCYSLFILECNSVKWHVIYTISKRDLYDDLDEDVSKKI